MKSKVQKSALIRPIRFIRVLFAEKIKGWCEGMSPKNRLISVIVAYVVLATGCLWMMVSAICDHQQHALEIEHIKQPELMWNKKDSLNIKIHHHEYE